MILPKREDVFFPEREGLPLLEVTAETGFVVRTDNEVSELHSFAKEILGKKVPTFKLLRPVRTYIKNYAKLIPQIRLVDEFDFLVETK